MAQSDTGDATSVETKPQLSCCFSIFSRIYPFLISILVVSYLMDRLYHPRMFGELVIGRWILSHGFVPSKEIWTIVGENTTIYSDGWLFSLLLAVLENMGGFSALLGLKFFLFVVICVALGTFCSVRAHNQFVGYLFSLPAFAGLLLSVPLVPELAGYALFVGVLACIYLILEHGMTWRRAGLLFALAVLYANLDNSLWGAVVCGLILFQGSQSDSKNIQFGFQNTLLILPLVLVGSLVTPYLGGDLLAIPSRINSVLMSAILRDSPATLYHYQFGFVLMLMVLLLAMTHKAPKLCTKGEILALLIVGFLSFAVLRMCPFALILASIVCSSVWGRGNPESFGDLGVGIDKLQKNMSYYVANASIGLAFFMCACVFVFVNQLFVSPVDRSALPHLEADYIASLPRDEHFPLLHDPFIGGYLIYRFAYSDGDVQRRLLADGRSVLHDPMLAYSLSKFENNLAHWPDLVSRYEPRGVLCRENSALFERLSRKPEWELVYRRSERDDGFVGFRPVSSWVVFKFTE